MLPFCKVDRLYYFKFFFDIAFIQNNIIHLKFYRVQNFSVSQYYEGEWLTQLSEEY